LSVVLVTSVSDFCTTVGSVGYCCEKVESLTVSTFTGWLKSTPPVVTTNPPGPVKTTLLSSFRYWL